MIDRNKVEQIFLDCMLKKYDEDAQLIINPTCNGFAGFYPEKIELHRAEILEMLRMLPIEFWDKESGGSGGWSFINMVINRDNIMWGSQHDANMLMALGVATGHMQYMFEPHVWQFLPGGVPYVIIHETPVEVTLVRVGDIRTSKPSTAI